jgi:hypothetical protein
LTYNCTNPGGKSVSFDISGDTLAVITKTLVYIKIKIPENEFDRNFQKEIVRTVMDIEKVVQGTNRNFIINHLAERFLASSQFELKFPLPKVRSIINFGKFLIFFIVSGILLVQKLDFL